MIKTSIILNSYNRAKLLDRGLYSIFSQDYPKDKYEVICLDDSSQDNTEEIALKYIKAGEPLTYIYRDKNSLANVYTNAGFCANIGIRHAKGEIIIRCDAEIIHDKESIRKLTEVHDVKDNLVCFAATYAIPYVSDLNGRIDEYDWKNDREIFLREKRDTLTPYIGRECLRPFVFLASIKKKHWLEMGAYDEDFLTYGCEDNFMVECWTKKGMEFIYLDKELLNKTGYTGQHHLDNMYEPYCCISYHQGHEPFGMTKPAPSNMKDSYTTLKEKIEELHSGKRGYISNLGREWGKLKKGYKIEKNCNIIKSYIENDAIIHSELIS